MRRGVFYGAVILLALIFIPATQAAGGLNCTVETGSSCPAGFVRLIGLENYTGGIDNAHVQEPALTTYGNSLCCESTNTGTNLSSSCGGTVFLKISNNSNAHVQEPSVDTYPIDVCIQSSKGTPSCNYPGGSCTASSECLLSMASSEGDDSTNAHVGACATYTNEICCSFSNANPVLVNALIGAYRGTPYSSNLQLYWPLEGNANDQTSNNNDGGVSGPTVTEEGRVGKAYSFSGEGDDDITTTLPSIIQQGTVAIWIKPRAFSGRGVIFDNTGGEGLYSRIESTDGTAWYGFHDGGAAAQLQLDSPNKWYFMTYTFDNNTNYGYWYVNGVLNTSQNFTSAWLDTDFQIGNYGDSAQVFNGTLDEVYVFDRILNDTEILALYNETRGVYDFTNNDLGSAPVNATDSDGDSLTHIYDWRMNDTSIATVNMPFDTEVSSISFGAVKDYSTYGNNGTLGNGNSSQVPVWQPNCKVGGCYDFSHIDAHITIPDADSLSPNIWSAAAWFKIDAHSGSQQTIFYKADGNDVIQMIISGSTEAFFCGVTSDSTDYYISDNVSLSTGVWHHGACVFDSEANEFRSYLNGTLTDTMDVTGVGIENNNENFTIGGRGTNFLSFNGSIDEFRFYDRALSAEQIQNLYNQGDPHYQIMGSNETVKHQNWSAEVTVNDGTNDSTSFLTNEVEILNSPPTTPELVYPNDGNASFTDRSPNLDWNASTDLDNDPITYRVQVSLTANFSSLVVDDTTTDSNYTPSPDLDFSPYYWRVYANDSDGGVAVSETFNFTIISFLDINLTTATVDFGSMLVNEQNDTVDDSPQPLVIENLGNIEANLSINATQLFTSAPLNTSNYQYKIDNRTGEAGAFDWATATTTFGNMSNVSTLFASNFNYTSGLDEAEIDLGVTVPGDEPTGTKTSTIIVSGEAS